MTPDGQRDPGRLYASLDDAALLSLLLVLRDEVARRQRMTLELAKIHREAPGPDAPPAGIGETLRFVAAAAAGNATAAGNAGGENAESLQRSLGIDAPAFDPDRWGRQLVDYALELGRREQLALAELVRRGLLPAMDPQA